MLRSAFVRRLKNIGEIPVPEGHIRRNKGVTTYFFDISKQPELEVLLDSQGMQNNGQAAGYVEGTIHWTRKGEGYTTHSIFLCLHKAFVSCAILRWPA